MARRPSDRQLSSSTSHHYNSQSIPALPKPLGNPISWPNSSASFPHATLDAQIISKSQQAPLDLNPGELAAPTIADSGRQGFSMETSDSSETDRLATEEVAEAVGHSQRHTTLAADRVKLSTSSHRTPTMQDKYSIRTTQSSAGPRLARLSGLSTFYDLPRSTEETPKSGEEENPVSAHHRDPTTLNPRMSTQILSSHNRKSWKSKPPVRNAGPAHTPSTKRKRRA